MNSETMKKTLEALRQELARASALDEESRQRLREIMRDAEGLGPTAASAPQSLHRHSLEELAVGFEIDHPTLAGVLHELVDLLAKAGM
jgi:hypothetical protein